MAADRTTRSAKNALAGIVNKIIGIAVPFLLRTIMIQKLGVEYLGLNSLFSSVLQMLSLTEMGFGSAMIYSMYKPIAENNTDLINALLNFYKRIYRLIGVIVLVIGLVLMPNITHFIASDYPHEVNIYIVFGIYLANTVVSYFLFAYKSSILIAAQRNDIETNIITLCNIFLYLSQIIALLTTGNYYVYIILMPCFTIINNIVRYFVVKRKFPQYNDSRELDKQDKKEIMLRVGALVGHRVGGVVFSSVDSLVISSFLGLVILGRYTNYFYIYTAINGIMSIVFQSILAVIGNAVACKTPQENHKIFKELYVLNAWQSCFCATCFICLFQPFMRIWMGKENMLPVTIALLLSIYYYFANIRRVCCGFKDAAGMWKDDFWKPYISVLVNLTFNIISVQIIGLPGVIISSILAIVVVESPWETKVLFHNYFKTSTFGYYKRYFQSLIVCIICMVSSYMICTLIPDTMIGFILRLLICAAIPNIIFILAFRNMPEYADAINRFKSLIGRNKKS